MRVLTIFVSICLIVSGYQLFQSSYQRHSFHGSLAAITSSLGLKCQWTDFESFDILRKIIVALIISSAVTHILFGSLSLVIIAQAILFSLKIAAGCSMVEIIANCLFLLILLQPLTFEETEQPSSPGGKPQKPNEVNSRKDLPQKNPGQNPSTGINESNRGTNKSLPSELQQKVYVPNSKPKNRGR